MSVSGTVCPPFLGDFTCPYPLMIWSDIPNQSVWCPEAVKKENVKILDAREQFEDSGSDIGGGRSATHNYQFQRSRNNKFKPSGD